MSQLNLLLEVEAAFLVSLSLTLALIILNANAIGFLAFASFAREQKSTITHQS